VHRIIAIAIVIGLLVPASPAFAGDESPPVVVTSESVEAPPTLATPPVAGQSTQPGPLAPVPALEVTAKAPTEVSPFQINLFASSSFSFNFNRPSTEQNGLRVFDTDDNTARIDVVELVLQHPASEPGSVGFRLDVTAGSSVPHVAASAGLFRDEMGVAQDFDVQQAFASYVAKLGNGLRIDAGKFVTHMGYEVIEGYDGYNDNFSRSILFGYAIPFTHTGIRVTKAFNSKVSGTLLLVNGWDNVKDNNERPSLGLQVALTPAPALSLWLNYIGGPEGATNDALRHVGNVVGTWKLADELSLALDAVAGHETDVVDSDGDMIADASATWLGAAAYVKLQPSAALSLTLRGEYFADLDGARTGADQKLVGVTLTPAWRVAPALVVRGDVRVDHSSERVFATEDMADLERTQLTAAVNLVVTY